ncbi:hypothetical protein D8I24_1924 [Cupriavidus necator H850]|nr:hypothetical protein D8I24_1924 [Cupriavidus necator H850]
MRVASAIHAGAWISYGGRIRKLPPASTSSGNSASVARDVQYCSGF